MNFARSRKRGGDARILVALMALALLAGCARPPGYIVDALPDTSFVESSEQRYLFSEELGGWVVIGLNGRIHRRLFAVELHIEDVSADGQTFVLRNTNTDLFIATNGGRTIRAVPEFQGLLGAVGISPDGRLVAATKHADFDLPQSQWVDDERLYLIDVTSLQVSEVGRFVVISGHTPFNLAWLDDHRVLLWLAGGDQQIDVRTGEREVLPSGWDQLHGSQRWLTAHEDRAGCGMEIRVPDASNGIGGIDIVRPGEGPTRLVVIEGARPPHPHESSDGIDDVKFTRDCKYVTFNFHLSLWVAEIASGRVGPILQSRHMTFEPWYPIGLP